MVETCKVCGRQITGQSLPKNLEVVFTPYSSKILFPCRNVSLLSQEFCPEAVEMLPQWPQFVQWAVQLPLFKKRKFKMHSKGINSLLLCGGDFWLGSWVPSLNDTWKWSIFGAEHLCCPEIHEVLLLRPSPSLTSELLTEHHWQTIFSVPTLGCVTQL